MGYLYKPAKVMLEIEADLLTRGREGRVGLDIFPEQNRNAHFVEWNQADNYYGLQQMRGLDGNAPHVKQPGRKTFVYEPGVWGEHELITETELTVRAGSSIVSDTNPIDLSDLVMERDTQLIGREFDRKEWLAWNALRGSITVKVGGDNAVTPATTYTDTYAVQAYSPTIPWSTLSTAVPIANMQTVQQMQVGHSIDFGAAATLFVNGYTAFQILNNANTADFGGRRNQFGATINNIQGVASYWQGQNLPNIMVYDGGYMPYIGNNTTAQFQKYILNGEGFLIGKRPGNARVGEMQLTRNANNPGARPGGYRKFIDYANNNNPKEGPPRIYIERGWNGGPAIYYPSAVVHLTGLTA